MRKRVIVSDYIDDENSKELKEIGEGELLKFSTHVYGEDGNIMSYDKAIVQLDDGTFKSVNLSQIKLKK